MALWVGIFLIPGLIVFLLWADRARRLAGAAFVSPRLSSVLIKGVSWPRRRFKMALWLVAFVALLLALGGPRHGLSEATTRSKSLDLMIAIDTSRSMLATDLRPNRLTRAKLAAEDLLRMSGKDRLGLVAFAGRAFLQCPLTLDDEAFRSTLKELDTEIIPEGGTALGEAMDSSIEAFGAEPGAARALVIISDGEDHEEGAVAVAKKAAQQGIRIFTLGAGSEAGEVLSTRDPFGNAVFLKDASGNVIKSRLNADLLREIAEASGGFYLNLDQPGAVEMLYRRGLEPMPRTLGATKSMKSYRERFQWPLAAAGILFLLEWLIREAAATKAFRRVGNTNAASLARSAILILITVLLVQTNRIDASPYSARRDFERKKYKAAREEYERMLRKDPSNAFLQYNAGTAALKEGEWKQSMEHMKEVIRQPDLDLQGRAYFNTGAAQFELGRSEEDPQKKLSHWEPALESFENAIKLRPKDDAARRNREELAKRVEEVRKLLPKQQQPQNQKKDDNKDSNKDDKDQEQDKNQQADQGKDDKSNKSDSKESKKDQASQDAKNSKDPSSGKNPQDPQENPSDKKSSEQQQAKNDPKDGNESSSGAKGKDEKEPKDGEDGAADGGQDEDKDGKESARAASSGKGSEESGKEDEKGQQTVVGRISPAMAERMLDAQKGKERAFPFNQVERRNRVRPKTGKDW